MRNSSPQRWTLIKRLAVSPKRIDIRRTARRASFDPEELLRQSAIRHRNNFLAKRVSCQQPYARNGAMETFRVAARYRQAAVEFKLKAEQETRPSKREYYFDLHRQYLRLAITCEEESEAA